MVISVDGLEELLSPLGFGLGAALEGIEVHVYIQGPAVRALTRKFRPRLKGWVATGHIPAQEKLRQLSRLGANLYVYDGSVQPFRVKPEDFIFDGLQIVEYLTFMSIMEDADIHIST